ncbi:hypothetical protein L1049_000380 [Liquidambar formosana]|uniref:Uncharacterized protein n=1 Tax=Liquidambar formosana TaxID=63359 RepID=A0AAP0N8P5_LIQFO
MIPNSGSAGSEEGTSGSNGGGGGKAKTTTLKKGPWTAAEDAILVAYVKKHGEGNWNAVQRNSGLSRCGKSCRLRWANHLRPNLKKGSFSPEEERLILELHAKIGNKWARMAAQLPGRTDNEIKNYWNTRVKRRLRQGLPLYPKDIQTQPTSPFHLQNTTTHTHPQTQTPLSPSPPTPQSHLSSPHQHKLTYNNHSLSLFEPISLSSPTNIFTPHTPPLLTSQFNRYKRYRNSSVGFSLPISQTQQPSSPLGCQSMLTQPSSPLGCQSMSTQMAHTSSVSIGVCIF